ncbi:MAG: hypothetical protein Q9165_006914 [Trypethelium subeluteriae]
MSPSTPSGLGQPVETQYEDAPPSYEDVIAQDLPPIDGPRRDYAPPPVPEGQSGFPEEKDSSIRENYDALLVVISVATSTMGIE